jgi:hypothetical protein
LWFSADNMTEKEKGKQPKVEDPEDKEFDED